MSKGYVVKQIEDIEPVPCPCGSSTRPITLKDTPLLNFHVTHIMDSRKHYHKAVTEAYYILEGSGYMELNDETIPVRPGTVILIEPYTAHRGYGDFKTIVVGVPAARHDDEFFMEEDEPALAGAAGS